MAQFLRLRLCVQLLPHHNTFPVAACAFPRTGSAGYLNGFVLENDAGKYFYFSHSEVELAVSNGWCLREDVYYSLEGLETLANTSATCTEPKIITTFKSDYDFSNNYISTSFTQSGVNICNLSVLNRNFRTGDNLSGKKHIYTHSNVSDNSCYPQSYWINCGNGNCYLYSCNYNKVVDTGNKNLGKKCTYTNVSDNKDEIIFSYQYDSTTTDGYKEYLRTKDGFVDRTQLQLGLDELYGDFNSCPVSIYYDNYRTKYYVFYSEDERLNIDKKFDYDDSNRLSKVKYYKLTTAEGLTDKEIDILSKYSQVGFGEEVDVSCEGILGEELISYINDLFDLIKIAVPIILIVLGCVDFGQAILSDDKDIMRKATSKFVKRCIVAIIIFFLPTLLTFLLNVFNSLTTEGGISVCGIG